VEKITPESLVKASEPANAPLHNWFTWNADKDVENLRRARVFLKALDDLKELEEEKES
jgi:hypothetical protein